MKKWLIGLIGLVFLVILINFFQNGTLREDLSSEQLFLSPESGFEQRFLGPELSIRQDLRGKILGQLDSFPSENLLHYEERKAPYYLALEGYRTNKMANNEFVLEISVSTLIPIGGSLELDLPNGLFIDREKQLNVDLNGGVTRTYKHNVKILDSFDGGEIAAIFRLDSGQTLRRIKILDRNYDILQEKEYTKPIIKDGYITYGGKIVSGIQETSLYNEEKGKGLSGYVVKGAFMYEDRVFDRNNFFSVVERPIRRVDVKVIDSDSLEELAAGSTDNTGMFELAVNDNEIRDIKVIVLSDTMQSKELINPKVMDPGTGAVYAVEIEFLNHGPMSDIDFSNNPVVTEFDTGAARPFNVLDVAKDVEDYLKDIGENVPAEDRLVYNWRIGLNDGKWYDLGENIYLMGQVGQDDDSYDDSVILHETGHYLTWQYSRFEEFFDGHGFSGQVDTRLAYTEGIATYLASAIRAYKGLYEPEYYRDPSYYVESDGLSDSVSWYGCFGDPLCTHNGITRMEGDLGAGNEVSVGGALYDIVDSTDTNDDSYGVDDDVMNFRFPRGDKLVWNVFKQIRDDFDVREKYVTMESFWDIFKELDFPVLEKPILQSVYFSDESGIKYYKDGFEEDNYFANAGRINVGEEQLHTFYSSEDVDYVSVNLNGDRDYVFYTHTLLDGADTVIELYDSNGVYINSSDDRYYKLTIGNRDLFASSLHFGPDMVGDYFLKIYRYNEDTIPISGEYGYYKIGVDENPLNVDAILPSTGSSFGGDRVTISGSGFVEDMDVWFGEYKAENITFVDDSTLFVITPRNVLGDVDVIVVYKESDYNYLWSIREEAAFSYHGSKLAPEIDTLSPSHGSVSGDAILKGKYFYGNPELYFGGDLIESKLISSREISFKVPNKDFGIYEIKLKNPDGQLDTLLNGFEISREYMNVVNEPLEQHDTFTDTIEVPDSFKISDLFFYINFSYYTTRDVSIILTAPSGKKLNVLENVPIALPYDCGKGCDLDWVEGIDGWIGFDLGKYEDFADHAGSEPFTNIANENSQGTWTLSFETGYGGGRREDIIYAWGFELLEHKKPLKNSLIITANEYRDTVIAFDPVVGKPVYQNSIDCFWPNCEPSFYPEEVTVSPDNSQLWFVPNDGPGITVINPFTVNKLSTIGLDKLPGKVLDIIPGGIIFTPDGKKVIVNRRYDTDEILIFSPVTFNQIGYIDHAGTSITATNNELYILFEDRDLIEVYDLDSLRKIRDISTFNNPVSAQISRDGSKLVVAYYGPNRISLYNTEDGMLIDTFTIDSSGYPSNIVLTRDLSKLYTTTSWWYGGLQGVDMLSKLGYNDDLGNSDLTTYNELSLLERNLVVGNWYGRFSDDLYILNSMNDEVIESYKLGPDLGYYIRSLDVAETNLRIPPKVERDEAR